MSLVDLGPYMAIWACVCTVVRPPNKMNEVGLNHDIIWISHISFNLIRSSMVEMGASNPQGPGSKPATEPGYFAMSKWRQNNTYVWPFA